MSITGKNVAVNGVANGGAIRLVRTVDSSEIVTSAFDGGAERNEGNVDFEGLFNAWGHTPTVFPNDTFTLAFTLDGGTTSSGLTAASTRCTGIDIVVPVYDKSKRNGVYYSVFFGCNGTDFSTGGATPAVSVAIPNVKGLACSFGGVDQTCVKNMKLSIRAINADPNVSSCTDGVYERPEGVIDWEFTYVKEITSMSLTPAMNEVGIVVMDVTDALNWTLSYGRVMDKQNIFDPESGAVIAEEITIRMCTDSGTVGSIVDPAGITQWPLTIN